MLESQRVHANCGNCTEGTPSFDMRAGDDGNSNASSANAGTGTLVNGARYFRSASMLDEYFEAQFAAAQDEAELRATIRLHRTLFHDGLIKQG
ncbi:hypothetical protein [Salipiger sp.]|uniref:hypothetical protein n=1 Tax=Salipiger sp. TaxID=2078585 RepID=UPI003A96AF3F